MRHDQHRSDHELGVFALLIDEHRLIAEGFDALERVSDDDTRTVAFETLARELLTHTHAEQSIVYSRLDHSRELEKEMERARHQHAHIEQLVQAVRMHDPAGDAWARAVEELRRAVEAHVEDEERDILPRAHLVIDDRRVAELATWYRAEKQRELERISAHH